MNQHSDSASEQAIANRKARDRSIILLVFGVVLLIPPFAGIFQLDLRIAGIPFTALYLFVVWGVLIACAAALSRRMGDDRNTGADSARVPEADV